MPINKEPNMGLIKNNSARERNLVNSDKLFPFEIVHFNEPANNMQVFHWHRFYELSLIIAGEGFYEIEDKKFKVSRGDIIVINNNERHRVTYKKEQELHENVIHFAPELIWQQESSAFDYDYVRLFHYDKAKFENKIELNDESKKRVNTLVNEINNEYNGKDKYSKLMIKAILLSLITIILRNSEINILNEYDFIVKRNNIDRVERILEYIHKHYLESISMASVSAEFYMNQSYFSDYFKKNIGINFSDYLTKLRINEAIKIMNKNKNSITETVFESGFNNVTSFYNAFKKITGLSPKEYISKKIQNVQFY